MTNKDLQQLVETISLTFFKRPFSHQATFNARLKTTGGRFLLQTHHIEINPKHVEHFGLAELEGIIKHELCHYHLYIQKKGYRHRDTDFKQLSKQVGAPRYCKQVPSSKKKNGPLYLYQCSACGQEYRRKRRCDTKRFVCGKCRSEIFLKKVLTTDLDI